ncbi:preprotein translocase subunit SecE [Sciscionella marina]|uniref:preprotein translocase subunit SecE n=1 Tax=Sciscionella marina TaxID=508770 RepID=UPI0003643050|nr:preprotein translocase subunit SecE [Sciscionella marina]
MTEDEGDAGREREKRDDSEASQPSRPTTAADRRERRRAAAREAGETGKPARPSAKRSERDTTRPAQSGSTTEKKGRPTPTRDGEVKADKPSVFKRLGRFLREVVAELRKVIWPTRKQMITYFTVVLVFVVVMTAFIFGLDYGLTKGIFYIFG